MVKRGAARSCQARPNSAIFRALAQRMGFDDRWFGDDDLTLCRTAFGEHVDFDVLLAQGFATLDLPDVRDDAHRVEDVSGGLFGVVLLGDGEYEAIALERGFNRAERARPAGRNRSGQPRKNDRPT